jgi:hypothetical protein
MYTINLDTGEVIRDSDGKVISPCQSTDDPDFLAYNDWIAAGNQPAIFDNSLNELKAAKKQEFEQHYNAVVVSPIVYMGHTFQCDVASQERMKAVIAAGLVPDGFFWRDMENINVPMTFEDLRGLVIAQLARGFAAREKLFVLKDAVTAATTHADVQAIVW